VHLIQLAIPTPKKEEKKRRKGMQEKSFSTSNLSKLIYPITSSSDINRKGSTA
jgi:hypothetical protein